MQGVKKYKKTKQQHEAYHYCVRVA